MSGVRGYVWRTRVCPGNEGYEGYEGYVRGTRVCRGTLVCLGYADISGVLGYV